MKDLNQLTADILAVFPTEQVRAEVMSQRRNKIHSLLLRHSADFKEGHKEEVDRLKVDLYIAEKALADEKIANPE